MAKSTAKKIVFGFKPEVTQIFNDLDEWRNYCRFNALKYDEADLYRSPEYLKWRNMEAPPQYSYNKQKRKVT